MPGRTENEIDTVDTQRDFLRSRTRKRFRTILVVGGILLAGFLVVAIWANRVSDPEISELMQGARAAFEKGDLETAYRLVTQVLQREPANAEAIVMAGKCLDASDHPLSALEMLSKVPSEKSPWSSEAAYRAGNILFKQLNRPSQAEKFYRRALQGDPASRNANDALAFLLGVSGQWWRQIPPRLATIRAGKVTRLDLFVLALADNALVNLELVAPLQEVSPNDPLVQLAAARLAVEDEEQAAAIALLKRAVEASPGLARAQVLLGKIHFERGDENGFVEWSRRLPPAVDDHPGVWVLRGKWALRHGHSRVALRCFCEAIQRDPNQSDALYQTGRILISMKRTAEAASFLRRAKKLQEFRAAAIATDTGDDLGAFQRAATLSVSLGNYWEAYGWAKLAAAHWRSPVWATKMVSRLQGKLPQLPLQRTALDHNPARSFDFLAFPLPGDSNGGGVPVAAKSLIETAKAFSFKNRAASAGISFRYFNGDTNVADGMQHMYQVLGGGIAVLDFNGDDLPDLYFTQGCNWPIDESKNEYLDRLYLNRGDGRFIDVTESCGIRENRFSQGVAVGDYDSDGFPDILVANIGRNRLYHNNGDGTFSDVSRDVGFNRSDWTSSCAIADLSGDGHPELYLVNYLGGADVFTRTCGSRNDGVCLPQHFPAANDRLFRNEGNGSFRDVSGASGIRVRNGKGLGIVVGSFGRSSGLNVFISNDTVANFYFANQGPGKEGTPRFLETALVSGLALNRAGAAQACMGIAAGDVDGDGAIDLFVTNFHGEPNTLYRQLPDGSFDDETMKWRLQQPSRFKLGFGTQFLDADLDGRLDLLVANGHIDNFSRDGRTEYQMQPQFFENLGKAGFREADSASLGPYFERKVLGRSMARLDWNRDGKEDVVILHLDAPIALLENRTQKTGGFLTLQLRGVQSSRDAIGAIVRVETKNLKLTRQLTAGDGFFASNERILLFGLAADETVKKMTVQWPSGRRQEFTDIPANSRWILVEGSERLLSTPAN